MKAQIKFQVSQVIILLNKITITIQIAVVKTVVKIKYKKWMKIKKWIKRNKSIRLKSRANMNDTN